MWVNKRQRQCGAHLQSDEGGFSNDSEEELGKDWDALEEEARRADKVRDDDDETDPRRAGKPGGGPPRPGGGPPRPGGGGADRKRPRSSGMGGSQKPSSKFVKKRR